MDAEELQAISERDQLWASLRALKEDIEKLAAADFDSSPRQQQLITLLARIVVSEMEFRAKEGERG